MILVLFILAIAFVYATAFTSFVFWAIRRNRDAIAEEFEMTQMRELVNHSEPLQASA